MKKEEGYKIIDDLIIAQLNFNKLNDHIKEFFNVPRCKKGIITFIDTVFSKEGKTVIPGYDVFKLKLLTGKSIKNSWAAQQFIEESKVIKDMNAGLVNGRIELMAKVKDYIVDTSRKLQETQLTDKAERQLYLRKAVYRFELLFGIPPKLEITKDLWGEIELNDDGYLSCGLDDALEKLLSSDDIKAFSSVRWGASGFDNKRNLLSIRNFFDYLDTFLEY